MPVYRLDLAYDGTGFRGYARQDGVRTVQGELEGALATLLKADVETSVAGRTDAGVHALGQVVSFPFDGDVDLERLPRAMNGIVGPELVVRTASVAPDDFSARFSAVWRRYRYLIEMGPPNPLARTFVWGVGQTLDVDTMARIAPAFLGEHDFASFCRSSDGKSTVRSVTELEVKPDATSLAIWIQANAFCHQMVRSIVGYLYDVGRGFSDSSLVQEVIAARDRSRVATVAPPHGLTLMGVGYASDAL
ncbi:MAG TPA: tRNA pseudouridine(38-40) synthase TruA [Acidimicrobiia bacterium]|nr:tRNA pseudouridine(38-40) synthase TruA [Acidimicrobiia bacterium]